VFTLIYNDAGKPHRHVLRSGTTTVGRAPGNDLILHHGSVSRRHAVFEVNQTTCRITDVGSRLHTYRNGMAIQTTEVVDSDVLTLGQVGLTVQESEEGVALTESTAEPGSRSTIVRKAGLRRGAVEQDTASARANRLLQLLADATGVLARTRRMSEILDRVVALTFESVAAGRVFLLLLDEHSRELVPRIGRTRRGDSPGPVNISRTVLGAVMRDKTSMLSTDVPQDHRLDTSESLVLQKVRSFMCAPLWTEHDVFGVLYVDAPEEKRFSESDLDLFTTVSNYAAVAIEQARLAARLLEETRRRERLQRYHSPAVAERIVKQQEGDTDTVLEAQEREVTVLFADLVGFTTWSERMAPSEVAATLNAFFTAMTTVIFRFEGTLDKFIGDAVLAVFGAPLDQPDHALRAVQAAGAMREALARLNESQAQQLRMRLAVNSGIALVGDIGAPMRREFTVLGDVVNIAARVQGQICEPDQILITGATFDRLHGAVPATARGSVQVKGRVAAVSVYEI
jgi:adenylate cyclase